MYENPCILLRIFIKCKILILLVLLFLLLLLIIKLIIKIIIIVKIIIIITIIIRPKTLFTSEGNLHAGLSLEPLKITQYDGMGMDVRTSGHTQASKNEEFGRAYYYLWLSAYLGKKTVKKLQPTCILIRCESPVYDIIYH